MSPYRSCAAVAGGCNREEREAGLELLLSCDTGHRSDGRRHKPYSRSHFLASTVVGFPNGAEWSQNARTTASRDFIAMA